MGRRCHRPHPNPFCAFLGVVAIALGFGILLSALLPWCGIFVALLLIVSGVWLVCQNKFH